MCAACEAVAPVGDAGEELGSVDRGGGSGVAERAVKARACGRVAVDVFDWRPGAPMTDAERWIRNLALTLSCEEWPNASVEAHESDAELFERVLREKLLPVLEAGAELHNKEKPYTVSHLADCPCWRCVSVRNYSAAFAGIAKEPGAQETDG
jgi:hypothetical protein